MKKIIYLLILILCAGSAGAQYTGTYSPMTAKAYQFKYIKIDSGLHVLKSTFFEDSVLFKGYTRLNSTPAAGDSSVRLANTRYVDRAVATGGGGSTTIYNGDGTLGGNRTVAGGGFGITWSNLSYFSPEVPVDPNGNALNFSMDDGINIASTGATPSLSSSLQMSGFGMTFQSLYKTFRHPASGNVKQKIMMIQMDTMLTVPPMLAVFHGDTLKKYAYTAGSSKWTDVGAGNIYRNSNVHIGGTSDPTVALEVTGDAEISGAVTVGSLNVSGNASIDGSGNIAGANLFDGTYTPTKTDGTNVQSATISDIIYSRSGNSVTLGGSIDIDPTAPATLTDLTFTLPPGCASDFSDDKQAFGAGFSTTTISGIAIFSEATLDEIKIQFLSIGTASNTYTFTAIYKIQ